MKSSALLEINSAYQNRTAVPAFNVYNLETVCAVFEAVKKAGRPAMAAFGEAYEGHMPLEAACALVRELEKKYGVRLSMHLDHCKSLDTLKRAVDCGFDSVMLDGSMLPFKDNVMKTAEAAEYAHRAGVAIEGELGGLNSEDGSDVVTSPFTDPLAAKAFVLGTKVDFLAVSVGNAHGLYREKPRLDMALINAIRLETGIPLVLHGSTGIPLNELRRAIHRGVAKINVNTEIALAGAQTLKKALGSLEQPIRLNQLLPSMQTAMAQAMLPFLSL